MDNRLHEADRRLFDPDGDRAAAGANEDRSNKIPTVGALLPQIGTLRASARLLGHDARRLMELGEFEESIADIEAMQGIARHAGEHPTLISQLVRISVQALAIDTARRLLESAGGALSAQDLTRLDRAFDPAITGDLAAITFDGERLIIRDVEQHSYTDNGAGNGRLRPVMLAYTDVSNPIPESSVFLGAPYSAIMPDRKSFRAMADSLYQAAERESEIPLWERGESDLGRLIASAERSAYTSMRWMYLLSFVPAYQRVLSKSDLAAMERDALRATIAMHRYRLGHGRWPERLTDLVPAYLDALPIDHYTGAPLRYRSDEAGAGAPKLYSVGHNFRDDGGAAATDRDGWPSNDPAMRWRPRSEVDPDDASIRGDIMFWPPLPEKPLEPLPEDD